MNLKFFDYDFVFSPAETEALRAAMLEMSSNPYTDFDRFMDELATLRDDRRLPKRFIDFCEMSMLRDFSLQPFAVIGGAPIDPDLPRLRTTDPAGDKYRLKKTFVAEGFLGLYAILTGTEMIGHLSVNDGDFFHDICLKEAGTQPLKFHRDFTNHFVCPDFVNTLTLRDTPQNKVCSTFTITKRAVRDLHDDDVEILSSARFSTLSDKVLSRAKDHPVLIPNQGAKVFEGRTVGLDDEAQGALDRFTAALHRNKQVRMSRPGDSVTFSHHHVIHGREVHEIREIRDVESLRRRRLLKTHNVHSLQAFEDFFLDNRYGVVNG